MHVHIYIRYIIRMKDVVARADERAYHPNLHKRYVKCHLEKLNGHQDVRVASHTWKRGTCGRLKTPGSLSLPTYIRLLFNIGIIKSGWFFQFKPVFSHPTTFSCHKSVEIEIARVLEGEKQTEARVIILIAQIPSIEKSVAAPGGYLDRRARHFYDKLKTKLKSLLNNTRRDVRFR